MFKTKIIYRLIAVFLVFAIMVLVPFSFTIIKQVNNMIQEEEKFEKPRDDEYARMHQEFIPKLIDQMIPYAFYILVMAFFLAIFFLRNMLVSLRQLQKGSLALKDGNLDIRLEVTSDDELGDATKAFNEMAVALKEKTLELRQKDRYINAMLDPLWVVDEDNNIVDVNPAFTRFFGYRKEDIVGASVYDFFDEKNAGIMRKQLEDRRDLGISSTYEINILTKEGVQVPVLISGSPIYSDDRIIGKIGILKDFREQNDLRNELRRSKEYVETVMDSIEDQLIVIDKDFRIIKANKIAMMNARGAVIGEYCHAVAHEKTRPCWTEGRECPAQTVFMTGRNYRTTHQHAGVAGEKKFHEIVASPIKDATGNVLHVIELIRDVTDRIRHEEEIFNKNRELVALNSVAGLLSRSLRSDEIFAKVLDKMIEMMKMDGGGIFFLDETKKEMTCQYHRGISDEYVKIMGRVRMGEDIPGRVAVTGQIITTADISKDARIERSIMKHSGMKGYCCIPIRGKERIIGVFCLFSFRTHAFTTEEESILNSIGEMTGIALENIRLYEKMRKLYEYQRKRREEEQAQMLSLSTKLGSAIELRDVLGKVLDLIKNFFGADFVWLLVRDRDENLLLKASSSFVGAEDTVVYTRGISSVEGYSLEKRTPTVIQDIRTESKFYLAPELAGMAYQSAISVPMYIGDKPVGVYVLYYLGSREFKEEDLHFLRIIANVLTVSIERSDYYSKSIMEKVLSDSILQSVAEGIITVGTDARIISVNRAFEKMTGVQAAHAVGMPICDVLEFRDENIDFRISLGECLEMALQGSRAGKEGVLTSSAGIKIPMMISSAPILDADGKVQGAVNLLRDISREKEIDRMKTDIIRSVSHEFRTPLSAIVGMTEMILDGDVDETRSRKYLTTILSEGLRLSHMVSDLLSIARIESGMESMRYETIDMKGLLKEIEASFSSLIEKKKASLSYDIDGMPLFVGDTEKIKQLLMNLVDNGLMFSDQGCTIEIQLKKSDNIFEIRVSDSGWGIPEEDMGHLTERFFRGRHGEKIKGTGLGLSLCSEIVKMHGGSMEFKSRVGKGTEVILSFPCKEEK
ncbi:MAG: PAS domain-containing protein [Nitrospirae bacterium]|nr:PAS domain-containing protein [Nitrospirota bacterium]